MSWIKKIYHCSYEGHKCMTLEKSLWLTLLLEQLTDTK
jgi:hypothetical protein